MIFRRNRSPVVTAPLSAPLMAPMPNMEENISTNAGPAKKILVVDDDPIILQTLSCKLKSRGFKVVTASDAAQAITTAREEKPDLMLLDINFPPDVCAVPWNGLVLAQWLRRTDATKNTPVIVISGADRMEYKERVSAVGAAGYFQKPINNDELLASIDLALCSNAGGEPGKPAGVFEI
jgi:DNA-binding response OmpR family regulator